MLVGAASKDVKNAVGKVIAGFPVDAVCCAGASNFVDLYLARKLTEDEEAEMHFMRSYRLGKDHGMSFLQLGWIGIRTDSRILATILAAHELGHLIYKQRHPIVDRVRRITRTFTFSRRFIFDIEVQAWLIAEEVLKRKGLWLAIKDEFMEKKETCLKSYA